MTRALRRVWLCVVLLLGVLGAPRAHAHELSMAEMEVRETAPGEFVWLWSAASDKRPMNDDLVPHWPERCAVTGNGLHCGPEGLSGTLRMEGVGERYSAAMVKVFWRDGQSRVYTLTAAQPAVELYGSAEDNRGLGAIARAYTLLGVHHILTGVDHLAFVLSLLFLVGFRRRLIGTITAFTLAHSVTLALSALGLLTLRPAPVEACIALSILLVASEALSPRETLARRLPALVSFLFGLVHGLGFAGALKDIGLPQRHLPIALLTFNVGVELGQLAMVGLAYGLVKLPIAERYLGAARRPALYAVGAAAAYWSWVRIAAIVA